MADAMEAFVNLEMGDESGVNTFADEYEILNRCEDPLHTPSSEELDLDLSNSIHGTLSKGVGAAGQDTRIADIHMADLHHLQTPLGASLGTSWEGGMVDSLAQMRVNAMEERIPGSWPAEQKTSGIHTRPQSGTTPTVAAPAAFSLSHIAPPSLPQERSSVSATSSVSGSVAADEVDPVFCSDAKERSPKRRASVSVPRKTEVAVTIKAGHKRSVSSAASSNSHADPENKAEDVAIARPAGASGEEEDSNDPNVLRRNDRLMRNRAAALASRERKREHVIRLEATLQEMEQDAWALRKENTRLHTEVARMQALLKKHGIDGSPGSTEETKVAQLAVPAKRISSGEAEQMSLAKLKAAPTGFSPRGALKKSQILADPIAAEEYLRQVALRQPPHLPVTGKSSQTDSNTGSTSVKPTGRGKAVIMILCFGIALFASVNPTPGHGFALSSRRGETGTRGSFAAIDAILDSAAAARAHEGNEAALLDIIQQFKMQGFQMTDPSAYPMHPDTAASASPRSLLTEAIHATKPEVVVAAPKVESPVKVEDTEMPSSATPQEVKEVKEALLDVPEAVPKKRVSRRRLSRASTTIMEEVEN